MLELYTSAEPIDVLTVTEHLALDGQARGRRRARPRSRRSPPSPPAIGNLRRYGADRQGALAPAPAAHRDLRDPELGPQPRGRAPRPRRAGRADDPRGRPRRPHQGLPRDRRRPPRTRSNRSSSSRATAARSPARRRASTTSTRSPAASSPAPDHHRGPPGMGKSRLVTNIAENVALNRQPRRSRCSAWRCREAELAQRFVASQAPIKGDDLRKGRVKDDKWPRVLERRQPALDIAPLYVDDSSRHRHARDPRQVRGGISSSVRTAAWAWSSSTTCS